MTASTAIQRIWRSPEGDGVPSERFQRVSVLSANTFAFTLCFATWTIFGEIGVPIAEELGLNATQFGLLTAAPILTGALSRLPLGILTDRIGGRPVFMAVMLATPIPLFLLQFATAFWHMLALGTLIGIAGGSFSVGISYVARFYPRAQQGFAMGVFGAGNAGAALTKYVAPTLIVVFSWQFVPLVYAFTMLVTALAFWATTWPEPDLQTRRAAVHTPRLREQLAVLADPKVLKYCQYYSVVFGGYVGLSLWLTRHYMLEYGIGIQLAALVATIFVLPSGVIRAFGGWLSDRFGASTVTWACMWASFLSLFVMSYPMTGYTIHRVDGTTLEFTFGVNIWVFTALLFIVGIAWGVGKASVFKYISDEYDSNLGAVSGVVGLAGGLGGFLLPIMFGALIDLTGVASTAFMLLFGATGVSLIWMWWTERRDPVLTRNRYPKPEIGHASAAPIEQAL
jgi:MFS transporter, NNP family, nitrate/nitrite transporter